MIATTLVQSRHLLELGLDPKTADMYWIHVQSQTRDFWKLEVIQRYWRPYEGVDSHLPAWSLSALLEVMPAHLKGWPADEDERLTLAKYHRMDADGPCYVINYSNPLNGSFAFPKLAHNPITAAYEMVCWLLEQGLIEKGGQND